MKISFRNIFHFKKKEIENKIEIKNKMTGEKVTIKKVYDATKKPNIQRAGASKKNKIKFPKFNFAKNKNKLSRGYYVLFLAMITLSAVSVSLTAKTYRQVTDEDYFTFETNSAKDIEAKEVVATSSTVENNVENVDKPEEKKDVKEEKVALKKKEEIKKETVKPLSFSKPISGEVIKVYSPDKVIYSKTLELWKTHDGIDIKADIGTNVKSIEKGIVEKVYDDSFYGKTIVIDHGQGYKSSYSNLDKDVFVSANQSITKGKVIGKISNTSIGEIKDEPHLHFMLFKDSNVVDPTSIFKQ